MKVLELRDSKLDAEWYNDEAEVWLRDFDGNLLCRISRWDVLRLYKACFYDETRTLPSEDNG